MSVKFHEGFSFDTAQKRFWWMDHFLGDQLQDEWREAGDAGGSAVVVDAQTGGIVRITTNNVTDEDWWIDWGDIRCLLISKKATIEYRAKLETTINMSVRLSLVHDGTNWLFFTYESDVSANWRISERDAGGVNTVTSNLAADNDWHIFRIECHTHGGNHAHFYIDGVELNVSPLSTRMTALHMEPQPRVFTDENVAHYMDIDYVAVRQER